MQASELVSDLLFLGLTLLALNTLYHNLRRPKMNPNMRKELETFLQTFLQQPELQKELADASPGSGFAVLHVAALIAVRTGATESQFVELARSAFQLHRGRHGS